MATYNLPAGSVGSPAMSLVASEVSTVKFVEDVHLVVIISNGTAPVWWTCDGSTPAVDGPKSFYIPAMGTDQRQPITSGGTVIKLVSSGTPTVRVQRGE